VLLVTVAKGASLTVTVLVAVEEAHPPAAAIVLVIVYAPGAVPVNIISPVALFANINPDGDELNVPALEPLLKTGRGFEPIVQKGPE
jgi:hypothetical protein